MKSSYCGFICGKCDSIVFYLFVRVVLKVIFVVEVCSWLFIIIRVIRYGCDVFWYFGV